MGEIDIFQYDPYSIEPNGKKLIWETTTRKVIMKVKWMQFLKL